MNLLFILACDLLSPYKDLPGDTSAPAPVDTEVTETDSSEPAQTLEALLELPCAQFARKDFLEIGVVYVEEDMVALGFSLYGISVDEDQISGAARSVSPDGEWMPLAFTGSAYAAQVADGPVSDCEMLFWAPSPL